MTHYRKPNPLWLLPLLISLAAAQQMDTANGLNSPVRTVSIFDEIQDSQERRLFKELWDTADPQMEKQRVMDFVERYPRSVVLVRLMNARPAPRQCWEMTTGLSSGASSLCGCCRKIHFC